MTSFPILDVYSVGVINTDIFCEKVAVTSRFQFRPDIKLEMLIILINFLCMINLSHMCSTLIFVRKNNNLKNIFSPSTSCCPQWSKYSVKKVIWPMTNLGDGPKKPTPKTKPSFEVFKSQTNRKRRNKPSTPPLITTTTEDTIFKLLLGTIFNM